ncbi:hypothetical protein KMC56_gp15 [Achromobacter phage vB_AxyP_19-32_Axy12]|uniref:Uncharacterized protein n=1 Tax=Achromobacter phage vB_AxyP_19-32_Axy12 TaxID=2591043 RepID=A0A514CUH5_9CAUD|nr:hypothetical protein KMC56_gp15 [Achromobacter phage vB_AxyP_19-32_Axy12]QDH84120.1 hypothetical protein Axy12_015 [Achromobacter phage vB_AxyP_19-32_Axy12]
MIFVFGSNTAGIHGGGAAHHAYKKEGARWGMGYGHYGNSFAIPTKGHTGTVETRIGNTLPLKEIEDFVRGFLAYARANPVMLFQVTRIGCGLAGLNDYDMAMMFQHAPANCFFDTYWKPYLGEHASYWGTF